MLYKTIWVSKAAFDCLVCLGGGTTELLKEVKTMAYENRSCVALQRGIEICMKVRFDNELAAALREAEELSSFSPSFAYPLYQAIEEFYKRKKDYPNAQFVRAERIRVLGF